VRQQLLDVHPAPRYTYGTWHRHAGAEEAVNRLALWMVHGGRIWLRSGEPAGKTHLLHALQEDHPELGLLRIDSSRQGHPLRLVSGWLAALQDRARWMLDIDAGVLSRAHCLALFHLIERAREMKRALLIAWRCPEPEHFAPAELSSRLRAFEALEIQPPQSDEDLRAVLLTVAASRQWPLGAEIVDLALLRFPRQLTAQLIALEELEHASLEAGRRLSPAWARRYWKQQSEKRHPPGIHEQAPAITWGQD